MTFRPDCLGTFRANRTKPTGYIRQISLFDNRTKAVETAPDTGAASILNINQLYGLQFDVAVEHLVPGQSLLVELLHEGIGIELLDVVNARHVPLAGEEHHGTDHGRHTRGVAYALSTGLEIGGVVAAVVVDVVGQ